MQLSTTKEHFNEKCMQIASAEFDLHNAGFTWQTNNQGIHLMIKVDKAIVADYFPTTGLLKFRKVPGFNRQDLYNAIFKTKEQKK